jgi:hypothetical protein
VEGGGGRSHRAPDVADAERLEHNGNNDANSNSNSNSNTNNNKNNNNNNISNKNNNNKDNNNKSNNNTNDKNNNNNNKGNNPTIRTTAAAAAAVTTSLQFACACMPQNDGTTKKNVENDADGQRARRILRAGSIGNPS